MLKSTYVCNRGLVRSENQDRAGCFFEENEGLYLVADGMGGHYCGSVASEAILSTFSEWWQDYLHAPQRPFFSRVIEQLQEEVQIVNEEIRIKTPEGQICGAAMVVLWLSGREYAILSAGDCRCYRAVRYGILSSVRQMTTDDVVRNSTPGRNGKLLEAVGAREECHVTVQSGTAPARAAYALCSDGVHKVCPPGVLSGMLRRAAAGSSLQDIATDISKVVQDRGAPDNYSLVLVRT